MVKLKLLRTKCRLNDCFEDGNELEWKSFGEFGGLPEWKKFWGMNQQPSEVKHNINYWVRKNNL